MSLSGNRCWVLIIILSLLAIGLGAAPGRAQQLNLPSAALSVNGTGQVDGTGAAITTSSQVPPPTPAGGAPRYYHRAAPRTSLELRIRGTPLLPILLATGPLQIPGAPLGASVLELAFPGLQILVDGFQPTSIFGAAAVTGVGGSWTMVFPGGLPPGQPLIHLQAAAADPTTPLGFRLTGTVSVEVRNDLETLMRNFCDSFTQATANPQYMPSLESPGFRWDGMNGPTMFLMAAQGQAVPQPETPVALDFLGIAPNTTVAPPLPSGAPASNQTATFSFDFAARFLPFCTTITSSQSRMRFYDVTAVEQAGVWKVHGNQRAAEVDVQLEMRPGTSNPQGVDVTLSADVRPGPLTQMGIASVSLAGPQLGAINSQGQAMSPAAGTLLLTPGPGGEVQVSIALAVSFAGTSRLPWIENGTGPRDVYTVTITWNDSSVSGPYSLPLRAAADPLTPSTVLAAVPGLAAPAPAGTLSAAGTGNATVALTFNVGSLANTALHGTFSVRLEQNGGATSFEFYGLNLPAAPSVQTVSLCVPGLQAGIPTLVSLRREDILACTYAHNVTLTF